MLIAMTEVLVLTTKSAITARTVAIAVLKSKAELNAPALSLVSFCIRTFDRYTICVPGLAMYSCIFFSLCYRACHVIIHVSLLDGPCDASELLQNAADVGDCTSILLSGESCTNIAFPGNGKCTASTCFDGILSPGNCGGATALIRIGV